VKQALKNKRKASEEQKNWENTLGMLFQSKFENSFEHPESCSESWHECHGDEFYQ
jgi:hypothetical protein